ncbi:Killer toxin subunits alpha/beta [Escovopsis weberi]|uniref:chitinase n=1 Tax=Escovopsis weberi TaxID=150374 RepID=A0A0M8MZ11_ESCWE|nr:Killer toxin subunits alpha/beta [Escovopsis weberi]
MAAIALLMSADGALARVEHCPTRCSLSGANTGNWSAYPSLDNFERCDQAMFYSFALYDPIDDPDVNHRVLACSSYGPDFAGLPASSVSVSSADPKDVDYEIGWWEDGYGLAASVISSLVRQMGQYLDNGHGPTDRPLILFARSGAATVGIYVGQALQKQSISDMGLRLFNGFISSNHTIPSPSVAIQLCEPGFDSTHIFGLVAMSNATFNPIQEAIKFWANGTCLPFSESTKIPAQAAFTAPLVDTPGLDKATHGNLTVHSNRTLAVSNGKDKRRARLPSELSHARLHARADCDTIQVVPGDSCAALATRCGVSPTDFTKYNPAKDLCAKLVPKQHVCCSKGDLPDFRPQKNSDGSCASYQVSTGDNCGDIAAANGLEMSDLEDFNKKTWGWNGCERLLIDTVMCLSEGDPPFPAPMANALCGPQVPGTEKPTNGTDFADLNPCPLNACCDVWGQCGITREFCIDTGNGAPGTAKAGTNGCISNCGTTIVKGKGDGSQRVAYYQGYGLSRKCLFQDALQIDTTKYTHVHFGFGVLTPDFQVETGDILSSYEFEQFKLIKGARRVLSFGGWDFSTKPATYSIFREGVTPENRFLMASNIANFIIDNGLDGVDIDWEYPGAPDIPNIPPASKDDGLNYLYFLVILKNLLGDRSVSIAAPSSYWYLKQYPIAEISRIIDYIVFMTYDLHGQWDSGNHNSQVGCDTGNCLRSQVNLTETQTSLAMITKAGVAAEKVVVGVTSYGRSFKMAEAGCYGPNCVFTGDDQHPQAAQGVCTGAAGIIANAEIADIIAGTDSTGLAARSSRVTANYIDPTSNSRILVYDDVQWVDYMDDSIKTMRQALYKGWGFAGTTDWASDLQEFHDSPVKGMTWPDFIKKAKTGKDPKVDESRTGNWTSFDCSDPHATQALGYTPAQRWDALDADGAWKDIVRIYRDTDRPLGRAFTPSVLQTLQMYVDNTNCGEVSGSVGHCVFQAQCLPAFDTDESGPAAQLIWDSLIQLHAMYEVVYDRVTTIAKDVYKPDGQQTWDQDQDDAFVSYLSHSVEMWNVSQAHAFVLDSGYGCGDDTKTKMSTYLDEETADITGSGTCTRVCTTNKFSAAQGVNALGVNRFGGVLVRDLIAGAVKTYEANGYQNKKDYPDSSIPIDGQEISEDDLTIPGLVRIPVCGPERAFKSWDTSKPTDATPNYPCDVPPGKIFCSPSTNIVNKLTDSSPLTEDCLQMIYNIQDNANTYWHPVSDHDSHQMAYANGCGFHITGENVDGNTHFFVGGQDLIDIINTVVDKFPGERVQAEGDMVCEGDVRKEKAHWYLSPANKK